jgi:hypothetical protein
VVVICERALENEIECVRIKFAQRHLVVEGDFIEVEYGREADRREVGGAADWRSTRKAGSAASDVADAWPATICNCLRAIP